MTATSSSAATRRMDSASAPSRSMRSVAARTMRSLVSSVCLPLTPLRPRATVYVHCTPIWGAQLSTHDLYTNPVQESEWRLGLAGSARFNWEYDDGRDRLL